MKDYTLIFVVGVILLIFVVIFFMNDCLSEDCSSIDNYEISDMAFDVCKRKCLEDGHSHKMCSDKDKLADCILEMMKNSSTPPPGTYFASQES